MLEMLNSTGGDVLRFAATVVRVRGQIKRAEKLGVAATQAAAVEIFCTPPVSSRRKPDVARLREDTQRFFGWTKSRWQAFESPVQKLIASAQTSVLTVDGHDVHCYCWQPAGKPRGRMLLCHGWEGYGLNFALLISKALDAGYAVHTFDHLAHGNSGGTLSGLPIVLQTLLAVAAHVKAKHGAIDVLVGHSLGGAAASWSAAHGEITVKRLVLLAPFYDTRKLSSLWAKAHFLSDEVRGHLQTGLEASTGKKFDDFMPESLAKHFTPERDLRVLIVHDQADKITAFKHSAKLAQLGSNVTLHEARKLGHIAILADEQCAQAVMDFVKA